LDIKKLKCVKEVIVAENKYVQVNMDILEFPNASQGSHIKVSPKNNGGVVLFVQNQNKNIYMHHGYHYASDIIQLEFIRGFRDINEESLEAAKRELSEEIIYDYDIVSNPEFLGKIYPDTSLLNSYANLFLVKVISKRKKAKHIDEIELLENGKFYSIAELNSLIVNGKVTDGYTLSSCAILKAKGII